MNKYVVHDSGGAEMNLGIIETDGSTTMFFKARRMVIDKLGDDYYTINDIVEQARSLYPKYNFIYDNKTKDIIL